MTENRIDSRAPDVPALVRPGHPVGYRALTLEGPESRSLACALWYPAAPGTPPGIAYDTLIRDGVTPTRLLGSAREGADPAPGLTPPLVLISHGYPGNRFLMSHLGEALAARGLACAAIDHPGSTYDDQRGFSETLYYRPLDQRAALDALARETGIDAARTAVIGYSMGGYGALVFGGAGLTQAAVDEDWPGPAMDLARHRAGSATHVALADPRVKALVAIGPWGRQRGLWDAATLGAMTTPLLLIAGDRDDISDHAAMRTIWAEAGGPAALLTFHGAGHNAAAPIPAPAEALVPSPHLDFLPADHYADPLWDSVLMNTLAQEVIAAFLATHLSGGPADWRPDAAWLRSAAPHSLTLESR
ncbi:MAG: alpha/beta fold hydrolase [Rhodobacteraceae bacterium]|nr:MAG: alpha/beta fold hydrolase [Paracoccaceae bacterium]